MAAARHQVMAQRPHYVVGDLAKLRYGGRSRKLRQLLDAGLHRVLDLALYQLALLRQQPVNAITDSRISLVQGRDHVDASHLLADRVRQDGRAEHDQGHQHR